MSFFRRLGELGQFGRMRLASRPGLARLALGLLAGVALLELFAGARAYRPTLTPAAWAAVAAALGEGSGEGSGEAEGGPVFLAEPWLGPRARRELVALRQPLAIAPPDLQGLASFAILSRGERDPWTPWLREAWGEGPPPAPAATARVGPLTLHRFTIVGAATETFNLGELAAAGSRALELRDDHGRCRGGGGGLWTCPRGKIKWEYAEIAYQPRRCLRLALEDGASLTIRLPGIRLGERLRGHLGVSDFNSRIRSDAPVLLEVGVDGEGRGAFTLSDRQGWAAFEVATPPGIHDLEVTITPALTGTWGDRGYDPRSTHTPCIELRGLLRGGGADEP